jgi:hypothetical protein
MLEEDCHRNAAFVLFHARQMPRIRFSEPTVESLGDGLWRLHLPVLNDRLMPTRTAVAQQLRLHRPDVATLTGATVVASGVVQDPWLDDVDLQEHRPERLLVPRVDGLSTRTLLFLVEGSGTVSVTYDSVKAGKITTRIPLR